jgi:glycosyltransferase involved in cell wall biosynthesis
MASEIKIHAICVVKNEVDIIAACLRSAERWADRIIVYDGESDDGTWEVVKGLANARIIPWKQDGKVFQESLRAEVFNDFKAQANPGDWLCHLDADEFYVENPRSFLAGVPWPYHAVWGIAVEFYLTEEDLGTGFLEPIENRLEALHYYRVENSEPRFFRHRKRLHWPVNTGWPVHMGPVLKKRILYKHYKYRSPEQIQRRLDTRRKSVARGFPGWDHAIAGSWRDKILEPGSLRRYNGGKFEYSEGDLPNHLEPRLKRFSKILLHQMGLLP